LAAKGFAEKTDSIIKNMLDAMEAQRATFTLDQSLELAKVHAMLAQAEAQEKVATAIWSLGDSVERAARN
jgi:hypothetical protein